MNELTKLYIEKFYEQPEMDMRKAYQLLSELLHSDKPINDIDEVFDTVHEAIELLKRALDKWGEVNE